MLKIKITGVDTNNKLILSDHGNSQAERSQNVKWKVKDPEQNVRGIYNIRWDATNPDRNNWNIFSNNPPHYEGSDPVAKKWKAIVNGKKTDAPDDAVYHYLISWQDKNGGNHPDDPIISIKPSKSFESFITYGLILLGMTGLFFWVAKSRAKARKAQQANEVQLTA